LPLALDSVTTTAMLRTASAFEPGAGPSDFLWSGAPALCSADGAARSACVVDGVTCVAHSATHRVKNRESHAMLLDGLWCLLCPLTDVPHRTTAARQLSHVSLAAFRADTSLVHDAETALACAARVSALAGPTLAASYLAGSCVCLAQAEQDVALRQCGEWKTVACVWMDTKVSSSRVCAVVLASRLAAPAPDNKRAKLEPIHEPEHRQLLIELTFAGDGVSDCHVASAPRSVSQPVALEAADLGLEAFASLCRALWGEHRAASVAESDASCRCRQAVRDTGSLPVAVASVLNGLD
jgi:hypothetical protein